MEQLPQPKYMDLFVEGVKASQEDDEDLFAEGRSPRAPKGETKLRKRELPSQTESNGRDSASSQQRSGPPPSARASGSGNSRIAGNREEVALATAELTLENKADLREVRGRFEVTVLLPADLSMVEEGLEEGRKYSSDAQKFKGQDIGSANVKIGTRTMGAMQKVEALKKDDVLMAALKDFWDKKVMVLSSEEMKDEIPVFRLAKPKTSSKAVTDSMGSYARLTFALKQATIRCTAAETLQLEMVRAFKEQNWMVKYGAAPRSQKERKLRAMIMKDRQ